MICSHAPRNSRLGFSANVKIGIMKDRISIDNADLCFIIKNIKDARSVRPYEIIGSFNRHRENPTTLVSLANAWQTMPL